MFIKKSFKIRSITSKIYPHPRKPEAIKVKKRNISKMFLKKNLKYTFKTYPSGLTGHPHPSKPESTIEKKKHY